MPSDKPQFLTAPDGVRIAYHKTDGAGPTVVFCGGFASDMTGTKATALQAHCAGQGRAFIRFDYRGHGDSDGAFAEGTIGTWLDDALAVIDHAADGPVILVGSSMGGWIALLAACARPDRVAGLLGIAAAPDFTERLLWAGYSEDIRNRILTEGRYLQPSDYDDDPYVITRDLIEDGRRHLLLDGPIPVAVPIRLIHGQQDPDVPYELSLKIAEFVDSDDVEITLVKAGDHRLSGPGDLDRLMRVLDELAGRAAAVSPT